MPHGLYRKLHRRYGPKLSGAAIARRALSKQAALANWRQSAMAQGDCANVLSRGVAVVGGGYAGLAAAFELAQRKIATTLFEARPVMGGRVLTDRALIPGRLIEAGAELIGFNHAAWITFAKQFGLGFIMLTDEDQYAGTQLEIPLRFKGKSVTDRKRLYDQMTAVFKQMSQDAKVITDPFAPWTAKNSTALDAKSVGDKIAEYARLVPKPVHPQLVDAIELQLANDNVLPTKEQSYLGLLALIAGGRFPDEDPDWMGYWTSTEDCRCAEGNDRLGVMLQEFGRFRAQTSSPVTKIDIDERRGSVNVTWTDPSARKDVSREFDYVILTVPPSVFKKIKITPPLPPDMEMASGPAVKYLSRVPGRFWIKNGMAPSALADDIGQTWEATENQAIAGQGIGLSVFAGGSWVPAGDGAKHFRDRLPTLLPGFKPLAERYVNWPAEPFIESGYVCPKIGQVTTVAKNLSRPHKSKLFFAGEHAAVAFFGYMEGALQSGIRAAAEIAAICSRSLVAAKPRREREPLEYPRDSVENEWPIAVGQGSHTPAASRAINYQPMIAPTVMPLTRLWPGDESYLEDVDPKPPTGVILLDHTHVERECTDDSAWTAKAGVSSMKPSTMNPGFIKSDDTLQFDTALNDKLARLLLDTPKFATMLSPQSRKDGSAHVDDRLRIALVDITGDKICKPSLAAWGPTLPMPGGSSSKVLIVFAAHQLIFDLNQLSQAKGASTKADLLKASADFWKGFTCPPDLAWLVAIDDSGATVTVKASSNLSTHLNQMVTRSFSGISTTRAAELIVRIGFEYLASVAFRSGLRHPTRSGVFYGRTYKDVSVTMKLHPVCHSGTNPIQWALNPLPDPGIVLTALSGSTFMTLLAQRRLVNETASTDIETLLQKGCGFVNLSGVTRRATKCGLTSLVRHDVALMEGSNHRYAVAVLTTNPRWSDRGWLIRELDQLIRDNNP